MDPTIMQFITNPYAVAGVVFFALYKLLDKYMDIRHKLQEKNFERQDKIEQDRVDREKKWHDAQIDISTRQVEKLDGVIQQMYAMQSQLLKNDNMTKNVDLTSLHNKKEISEVKNTVTEQCKKINNHEERITSLEKNK